MCPRFYFESVLGALVAATLVAAGDLSSCGSSHDEQTAALVRTMPGTLATLGDTVYDRWSCFAWAPFRQRIRPAIGNHDVEVGGFAAYFGLRRTYYAYTLGAWRVIVLDSEHVGAAQRAWLRAELRDHPSRCTLAYWHRPRWSSGFHGSSAAMDVFWKPLAAARAEVVLGGHDHHYERFAPRGGVRQFVVGTGGRSLYPWGLRERGSQKRVFAYGVLRLSLRPGTYTWRFVDVERRVRDRGSGTCA
jgi:hypothetical protein